MSQTRLMLLNHLHPDLVGIVLLYFQSTKRKWKQMARAGEYEACLQCPSRNEDVKVWEFSYEAGLRGALEGGYLAIVEMMIHKGARNMDRALRHACRGGHMEMVKYVLNKGVSVHGMGLHGAREGRHFEIEKLMLAKIYNSR